MQRVDSTQFPVIALNSLIALPGLSAILSATLSGVRPQALRHGQEAGENPARDRRCMREGT